MKSRVVFYTFAVAASLTTPVSFAEIPTDVEARVRAIVEEERARAGTPAISVAVFADGRIVSSFAVGYADVERKVPATPNTLFQAASVTKTLTAALVMHEVEVGRLSLDSNVNDALPPPRQVRDRNGKALNVTLGQLLSHSSGLPFSGDGIQTDPKEAPRSLDEHLSHGLIAIHAPGERLVYANAGFSLAGWLAAQVENTTYDALAQKILLDPLRMTQSSFKPPRDAGDRLATAYGPGGPINHLTVSAGAPAGALLTTANDLARFGLMCLARGEFDGARILRPESIDSMLRLRARVHPRVNEGFGLGFGIREIPDRKLAWWDGQLDGAASRLAVMPEHNVGVAVLANRSDNAAVALVGARILELFVPPSAANVSVGPEEKRKLTGVFRVVGMMAAPRSLAEPFINLRIRERDDGRIAMGITLSDDEATLIPRGDGVFEVQGTFLHGAYGIVDGDRLYISVVQAERVPEWLSGRALLVYVGATLLAISSLLVWGAIRFVRRLRARQPA